VAAKVNWKRTDTQSKGFVTFREQNGEQKPKTQKPKQTKTPKQTQTKHKQTKNTQKKNNHKATKP